MHFRDQLKLDLEPERYKFKHLAKHAEINSAYLSRILTCQITPGYQIACRLAQSATKLTGKIYTPEMFLNISKDINHD